MLQLFFLHFAYFVEFQQILLSGAGMGLLRVAAGLLCGANFPVIVREDTLGKTLYRRLEIAAKCRVEFFLFSSFHLGCYHMAFWSAS